MEDGNSNSNNIAPAGPVSTGLHAHWDCFSGAAGDMMFAACLHAADHPSVQGVATAGSDVSVSMVESNRLLEKIIHSIKYGLPDIANEFDIQYKRVWKGSGSIAAYHVNVTSVYNHQPVPVPQRTANTSSNENEVKTASRPETAHNHTHSHNDFEHHHNHDHHGHSHDESENNHNHTHSHSHDHSTNNDDAIDENNRHIIRNLPQIRQMLLNSNKEYIPIWVRDHAIAAFTELAKAEATVHGAASIDDVHFHEVGAIDSIVDTISTLLALYYLNITSFSCSRIPLGEGMVRTAHGILPVPAPATLHLMVGMLTTSGPSGPTGELVTPTAMSLLRVLVSNKNTCRAPNMTLQKVGIGAGTKDFVNHPNVIRLLIGELN